MGTFATTGPRPGSRRVRSSTALLAAATALALLAGCSGGVTLDPEPAQTHAVRALSQAREPQEDRIAGEDPGDDPAGNEQAAQTRAAEAALLASQAYFESAQVVVLAPVDDSAAILRAASIGAVIGAPSLLTAPPAESTTTESGTATTPGELNTELVRLGARAVVTVGDVSLDDVDTTALIVAPAPADDAELSTLLGHEVRSSAQPEPEDALRAFVRRDAGELFAAPDAADEPEPYGTMPETTQAERLEGAVVVTRDDPVLVAAAGTAAAAGARVLIGTEPLRGDADLIGALGEQAVTSLVAMGEWSPPAAELETILDAIRTGVQLPGGGQLVFGTSAAPVHYVSLYGSIQTDRLGPLGEQDAAATMSRAIEAAAEFTTEWDTQVVPAVEILATVADEEPGESGRYSHMWPAADIEPWIVRAQEAGVLVLLTFQPGRYSFLEQVQEYASLLEYPNVGVRLEPQWRYETAARAADGSGSVDAGEVNDVVSHLSALVARENLPTKLVAVSEASAGRLRHRDTLITDDARVPVLVNVDAGGEEKAQSKAWTAVREGEPEVIGALHWGYTIEATRDAPATAAEKVRPRPDWVSLR